LNQPVVDYLVARTGLPAPRGQAYDYVLAGDGVFVVAENPWLQLRVPIAKCTVRGLGKIYSACTLVRGRLPAELWFDILTVLRLAHNTGHEVFVGVRHDSTRYRLLLPQQVVTPVSVSYLPQDNLVLELHSHGDAAAHFSVTDTSDEQRLRLYGVVGCLSDSRPHVSIRAGAYGYYMPVAWTSVFGGHPDLVDDRELSVPCTPVSAMPTDWLQL
jgi:PRTRC genetic system protein A